MTALRDRLARQPPGYNFTIGRILAIYAGLMLTLLLAALDQTIVATALPRIVSDLGGITQYSWVFTAYMLTSTVTVPLYGKLGDVYGRKNLFLFALVVVAITMPRRAPHTEHAIDWLGAGVLAGGTAALLMGLVWGGKTYPWTSGHVVGAFALAAVLLLAFWFVERRADEPILPFEIL